MQPEPTVLAELVDRIVEAVHPLRIVLFGSAARGELGPTSDLDVLVVVPDSARPAEISRQIYRHLVGLGVPTDVVIAREDDLRRLGDNWSLVYYWALREGREIYGV